MANFFKVNKFQEDFHSEFNEETGISTASFNNKYGKFIGIAKLNPADEPSKFIGQHIAECRANIQYYTVKYRIMREKFQTINSLYVQDPVNSIIRGAWKEAKKNMGKANYELHKEKIYLETYIADKFGQK